MICYVNFTVERVRTARLLRRSEVQGKPERLDSREVASIDETAQSAARQEGV